MKKLNRKLIPAFAMLLLSAVLMSTASFAWFSQNTTVTATGIQVTATAPAALWIANDEQGPWDTHVDMSENAQAVVSTLMPVTTNSAQATIANAENWKFYSLNTAYKTADGKTINLYELVNATGGVTGYNTLNFPENSETGDADVTKELVLDKGVTGDDGKTAYNYYKTNFYLYLEGDATRTFDANVKAKVTATGDKVDDILKAMRVAVVPSANAAGADPVVFQPTKSGEWIKIGSGTDAKESVPLATVKAQEALKLTVYVWFEGTDGECINEYSVNKTVWNVEFAFE